MTHQRKILLTVAGFDPSGGAGVLLDAAVWRGCGFRVAAVLTAVTVQNTAGVKSIHPLPARLVRAQWRAVAEDGPIAGIKIGMAGTAINLLAIVRELERHPGIPRIVDPVFRASSGARLIEPAAAPVFLQGLRGRATLLTPNLEEASRLAGIPVRTVADMEKAAGIIFERSAVPCLVKGGHLSGAAVNLLYDGRRMRRFARTRLAGDVHGSGCYLSSSILAFLALGRDLPEAVRLATAATHRAIRRSLPAGCGRSRFDL